MTEATAVPGPMNEAAGDTRAARLYRAADCYVGNSDFGTGTYDSTTSQPGCCRVQSDRTVVDELLLPLTPGSTSLEDYYQTVWGAVAAQGPLPDTCQRDTSIDNGLATSWLLDLNGSSPVTAATRFAFAQPSP